jgi:hypothetical protein
MAFGMQVNALLSRDPFATSVSTHQIVDKKAKEEQNYQQQVETQFNINNWHLSYNLLTLNWMVVLRIVTPCSLVGQLPTSRRKASTQF